jgi:plastocyanin/mono/diheme cytochrome c family protein
MRRVLASLAVVGAALGLSACGSDTEADLANGKAKFAACGACHALADAGTEGLAAVEGVPVPSLDDAFRGARQAEWRESQIKGVVLRWIRSAALPMPRDQVTGKDAEDVAAYVASVAGKDEESAVKAIVPLPDIVPPGGLAGDKTEPARGDTGGAPGGIPVDADPGGDLAFVQTELDATAGEVTLELRNESAVPHNIAVRGNGVDSDASETIQGGATAALTVELAAGEYEFYCAVPGHFEAGMKGTLTVK